MDTGERQCGVVAQELEAVLPEAVMRGTNGMLSVAYGHMGALLLEAIRDLNLKVDGEVAALREEIRLCREHFGGAKQNDA